MQPFGHKKRLISETMNKNRFWQLLKVEHSKAEAFCRRLAGNRDDGDDLYQEALLTAWNKFDNLRDENSFRPWLYRIMVNKFKSWYRTNKRLEKDSSDSYHAAPTEDITGRLFAKFILNTAFKSISAEDRSLIILYEIEGWTVAELSSIFAKPEGTIKARLSRARKKMRERIKDHLQIENKETKTGAMYALQRSKTSIR
jgi:RNA polymerase sigma-70 factor (ECF subfamily)